MTTRPSSDRVREALFSAVESWCGSLQGLRFLDLYAGSGAVGLEAWSRGAGVVTLVEQDRRTAALIIGNAKILGFTKANVVVASVAATLLRPHVAPYDVVFLDPPYPIPDEEVDTNLERLSGELAGARRHGRGRALVAQPAAGLAGRVRTDPRAEVRRDHALVRSRRPTPLIRSASVRPVPSAPGRSTRSRWAISTSSAGRRGCSTRSWWRSA